MSSTVEVYLRYPGDAVAAVARVSLSLGARGYFGSPRETFRFTLWPQAGGLLGVDLSAVEEGPDTALSPYDFGLSMELMDAPAPVRGEMRERAGREVFDRLTALEVPLAYGDHAYLFADFLPGRGVREFPPGTGWEEDDRDVWFEPRLHGTARPADTADHAAPFRPAGSVRVFETDGLVHFVPWGDGAAMAPVASVRASSGQAVLGRMLAETLGRSRQGAGATTADPWSWVTGTAQREPGDYARAAVSIDIEVTESAITAVPHGGVTEPAGDHVTQGPVVESLAVHQSGPWDDASMGDLVLRLIRETRARVPS